MVISRNAKNTRSTRKYSTNYSKKNFSTGRVDIKLFTCSTAHILSIFIQYSYSPN